MVAARATTTAAQAENLGSTARLDAYLEALSRYQEGLQSGSGWAAGAKTPIIAGDHSGNVYVGDDAAGDQAAPSEASEVSIGGRVAGLTARQQKASGHQQVTYQALDHRQRGAKLSAILDQWRADRMPSVEQSVVEHRHPLAAEDDDVDNESHGTHHLAPASTPNHLARDLTAQLEVVADGCSAFSGHTTPQSARGKLPDSKAAGSAPHPSTSSSLSTPGGHSQTSCGRVTLEKESLNGATAESPKQRTPAQTTQMSGSASRLSTSQRLMSELRSPFARFVLQCHASPSTSSGSGDGHPIESPSSEVPRASRAPMPTPASHNAESNSATPQYTYHISNPPTTLATAGSSPKKIKTSTPGKLSAADIRQKYPDLFAARASSDCATASQISENRPDPLAAVALEEYRAAAGSPAGDTGPFLPQRIAPACRDLARVGMGRSSASAAFGRPLYGSPHAAALPVPPEPPETVFSLTHGAMPTPHSPFHAVALESFNVLDEMASVMDDLVQGLSQASLLTPPSVHAEPSLLTIQRSSTLSNPERPHDSPFRWHPHGAAAGPQHQSCEQSTSIPSPLLSRPSRSHEPEPGRTSMALNHPRTPGPSSSASTAAYDHGNGHSPPCMDVATLAHPYGNGWETSGVLYPSCGGSNGTTGQSNEQHFYP